jgi:hypothetical protein
VAVFEKTLTLNTSAVLHDSSTGQVTNLMSSDAQKLFESSRGVQALWSAPLQIVACLIYLWYVIGPSMFAGLVCSCVICPVFVCIAIGFEVIQTAKMKHTDTRVQLTTELVTGIRLIKFFGWEEAYIAKLLKIRLQVHVLFR